MIRVSSILCSAALMLAHLTIYSQQVRVPVAGNTWSSATENKNLGRTGIADWQQSAETFTTYIRLAKPGKLQLSINANTPAGSSTVGVSLAGKSYSVTVGEAADDYRVGDWEVADTGYIKFVFSGIKKSGCCFANIKELVLSGSAISDRTAFVKNNEGNFFYWGRRGPSTHLNYKLPDGVKAEWFYNELTVPEGNDVIGSYFMANGFGEGYFGIQVNAPTERRVLFSVWSPFSTDNPKEIPEEQKIKMLKKGDQVYTGEFGGEGSGGQSFLRYSWKAGVTQKFLLHAVPDGANHTIYTAYFFDHEKNNWRLIASFRRPTKATYLTRLHSFLENFNPSQGNLDRKVLFSNQWVKDNLGKWHELTEARFTADNTARKGYRQDYEGGVTGNDFFLHAFGFFSQQTPIGATFSRPARRLPPAIDFGGLE
ncbi:DUF3472 domain-containing protein [Niabella insulamsoli]|uniref:DUF3472 domain-containing protein n=1 Tax=Niabella insulamsoli TaxID=3144874 RepID=UPI0031FDC05C